MMLLGVEISSIIFLIIFICFGVILTLYYPHTKISVKQFKIILFIIGILLFMFTYCFEPNPKIRWDLIEHYREVNSMHGKTFSEAFVSSGYSGIYSIVVIYYYIISRIGNLQLLPVFPVLIDYAVFCYIFLNCQKQKNKYNNKLEISNLMFIMFVWFSTIGVKLAISGIRCVLASSIISLAVYLYFKDGEKWSIKVILLFIVSTFIHSFSCIIILIFMITKIKYKKTVFVLMLFFSSVGIKFIDKMLPALLSVSTYLYYSAEKIVRYWNSFSLSDIYQKSGLGIVTVYICMIIISIFLLVYSTYVEKNVSNEIQKKISSYCTAVAVVALGISPNYLFIERLMYIEAFAFVMIFSIYKCKNKNIKWLCIIMIPIFAWTFLNNDITTFIVNYTR